MYVTYIHVACHVMAYLDLDLRVQQKSLLARREHVLLRVSVVSAAASQRECRCCPLGRSGIFQTNAAVAAAAMCFSVSFYYDSLVHILRVTAARRGSCGACTTCCGSAPTPVA
jgi:hypothetical protein